MSMLTCVVDDRLADASGSEFDEGVQKIGVLGVVVLLLALSSYLVRRKEREPAET